MTPEALILIERYNRAIAELEDEAIARINAALDASFRNLDSELRRIYPGLAENDSLLPSQRRILIESELKELLTLIRPQDAQQYEALLQETLRLSSQTGTTLAERLVEAIAPDAEAQSFAQVPIEAVALQARDGVQRLYRHAEDFRNRASAAVEQGLIQGWGATRVSQVLRSELGTTKANAERIARTEVMSALNDAAQQGYAQNGLQTQWIATPSEALCPFCAARNGLVYEAAKVRIPAHPHCRCVAIPYSSRWQELGLAEDEFIADYRNTLLNELQAAGKTPNYGVTPFERAAGLQRPPEPIWQPGIAAATTKATGSAMSASDLRDRIAAGGSSNDLAYQYARQNYTAPQPQRRHGMTNPQDMWSVEFEGVRYHDSGAFRANARAIKLIEEMAATDRLPRSLSRHTTDVYISGQRNKDDSLWEQRYGIANFRSAATGGQGSVVFYDGAPANRENLLHEMGHNLALGRYGAATPPSTSDYASAMQTAAPPTRYAAYAPAEDFAESVRLYFDYPELLQRTANDRYTVIRGLIGDENYDG